MVEQYRLYQPADVAVGLLRICTLCLIFALTNHIFFVLECLQEATLPRLSVVLCVILFLSL